MGSPRQLFATAFAAMARNFSYPLKVVVSGRWSTPATAGLQTAREEAERRN